MLFIFTIFTIFTNTGCLIYPARSTCFENLSWAIPLQQVDQMYLWYEQWSKGGAGPNFRVENPVLYVANFNWVRFGLLSSWVSGGAFAPPVCSSLSGLRARSVAAPPRACSLGVNVWPIRRTATEKKRQRRGPVNGQRRENACFHRVFELPRTVARRWVCL